MDRQPLPLEVAAPSGSTIYAVVRGVVGGDRQVWNPTLNTGAGGWETYNVAHWAQYPVALTEDEDSGYFCADYPANIGDVITTEMFYTQAGGSPASSDSPVTGLSHTQGENMTGLTADVTAAKNLAAATFSEQRGAVAGVPTASIIPTDLQSNLTNSFAGRSLVMTSGVAFQCAGRIVGYAVTNGVLTLAAPLAIVPEADDTFIIV